MDAEHRLATYGSLAPGEVNHGQLDGLRGTWRNGTVRGRLLEAGWGAGIGFPGLILDEEAFEVPVSVFDPPTFRSTGSVSTSSRATVITASPLRS